MYTIFIGEETLQHIDISGASDTLEAESDFFCLTLD